MRHPMRLKFVVVSTRIYDLGSKYRTRLLRHLTTLPDTGPPMARVLQIGGQSTRLLTLPPVVRRDIQLPVSLHWLWAELLAAPISLVLLWV